VYCEDQIIQKAIAKWFRDCETGGFITPNPSSGSAEVEGETVTLSNIRGTLVSYKFRFDKRGRILFAPA